MPDNTTNDDGLTFDQWLAAANRSATQLCGLSLDDMPDGPTWSNWEAGTDPADYAREIIEQEMADYEMAKSMGFGL